VSLADFNAYLLYLLICTDWLYVRHKKVAEKPHTEQWICWLGFYAKAPPMGTEAI